MTSVKIVWQSKKMRHPLISIKISCFECACVRVLSDPEFPKSGEEEKGAYWKAVFFILFVMHLFAWSHNLFYTSQCTVNYTSITLLINWKMTEQLEKIHTDLVFLTENPLNLLKCEHQRWCCGEQGDWETWMPLRRRWLSVILQWTRMTLPLKIIQHRVFCCILNSQDRRYHRWKYYAKNVSQVRVWCVIWCVSTP